MLSRFFIERPIFASVLSIVITLAGAIAVTTLPIAQYPDITPPTVQVTASYPGANAQLVLDTVAAPIEQQVNGVENMLYMSSQCTNDGMYKLTITFALGTDLNTAQVLVQNRVQLAMPVIPSTVQLQGVAVTKKSPSTMMIVNFIASKDSEGKFLHDDLFLSNYATIHVRDELLRLHGVGDVTYIGQRDYSMRAWLNPDKLAEKNMTASDVVQALQEQNIQVAAGQIGQEPVPAGQSFQLTMATLGRLLTAEQFGDVILKRSKPKADSQQVTVVRLRDVAEVQKGAQRYDQSCTLDGQPSVALSIYQLPGSNALKTAEAVEKKMEELAKKFPEGLEYKIVYNTTPFIHESIFEVLKTLRDATLLVALVVLVFLQNWRATLIPLAAVPVAVIGTFAVMAAMGFSLNNLSLFGLVLAIGIVVDDAIVVVENVERWLEQGLAPREAAEKAMEEVTGPVVAVALVLCAVFVPCAFLGGIIGQFFRQFALTIAVSTVISAINSLTLSPALAALLLKPHGAKKDFATRIFDFVLGRFFQGFNAGFNRMTGLYAEGVRRLLRGSVVVLGVYGGLLWLTYWSFTVTPTGFIPQQDKGYLLVNAQLPDGASVQRTREVMQAVERIAREIPGVAHTVAVSGQSLLLDANASNFGSMYVMLDEFSERRQAERSGEAILKTLRERCNAEIRDAVVSVFQAPTVDGLGNAGGFKIMLEDRGNLGMHPLQEATDGVVGEAENHPMLAGVFTGMRADAPWIYLDIDRLKAGSLAVSLGELFNTLQVYLGSLYVNNFNEDSRTWQVNVQAGPEFRESIESLQRIHVRSETGKMVPLGTLMSVRDVSGPAMLCRYNMYPAAPINGDVAQGAGSGNAISALEDIVENEIQSRRSMAFEWTELAFMQILSGNTAMYLFVLAVVLVFLVLAAQYESWSLPLAVILVVPMCLLCSIVGVAAAGMDINIFTQIGFVVLVGLAGKNAILIVEFAKAQRESGIPAEQATVEACRLRLRPIMMTSFAFILGVVPLVLASGAGAEMRRTLGTAVFSGMLGVTAFGIFLTPVFFYVIDRMQQLRKKADS